MVRKVAKNVARNKKKYWRKIPLNDIEDHLEDVRQQEIAGGRRSDQPNEVLYQIDTTRPLGADDEPVDDTSVAVSSSRPALNMQELNTYKLLKPHSSVKPVAVDLLRKQPASKSTKRLGETQRSAFTRHMNTKTQIEARRQRMKALHENTMAQAESLQFDDPNVGKTYDLWNSKDEKKEKKKALVGHQLAAFMDQVSNTYEWKVPKHVIQKPSALPPVEPPLQGISYNPSYSAHQELLQKAVDVEVEKQRKEEKLLRRLPKMLPSDETLANKKTWLKEMATGLFEDDTLDEMDRVSPSSSLSVGKPVTVNLKTRQERRKTAAHKRRERKAKVAKEKRIRENTFFRVKSIGKSLDAEAKQTEARKVEEKEKYEHNKKFGTKKFGRYKFEEPDLELNLSEEISGNLRNLKAEGNLLHDRFKSFQKRNVIETRVRAKQMKPKLKKYVKRSVREVGVNYRPK